MIDWVKRGTGTFGRRAGGVFVCGFFRSTAAAAAANPVIQFPPWRVSVANCAPSACVCAQRQHMLKFTRIIMRVCKAGTESQSARIAVCIGECCCLRCLRLRFYVDILSIISRAQRKYQILYYTRTHTRESDGRNVLPGAGVKCQTPSTPPPFVEPIVINTQTLRSLSIARKQRRYRVRQRRGYKTRVLSAFQTIRSFYGLFDEHSSIYIQTHGARTRTHAHPGTG